MTSRATLKEYVPDIITNEDGLSANIFYPKCIISTKDGNIEVVSKRGLYTTEVYSVNDIVLIQYNEDDLDNFVILEKIDDRKQMLYLLLIILDIILLSFLVNKYGISITEIRR